jgi:hypothetical protein
MAMVTFGSKCEDDDDDDIDSDTDETNDNYWMLTVCPAWVKCFTYINTNPPNDFEIEILNHLETNKDLSCLLQFTQLIYYVYVLRLRPRPIIFQTPVSFNSLGP